VQSAYRVSEFNLSPKTGSLFPKSTAAGSINIDGRYAPIGHVRVKVLCGHINAVTSYLPAAGDPWAHPTPIPAAPAIQHARTKTIRIPSLTKKISALKSVHTQTEGKEIVRTLSRRISNKSNSSAASLSALYSGHDDNRIVQAVCDAARKLIKVDFLTEPTSVSKEALAAAVTGAVNSAMLLNSPYSAPVLAKASPSPAGLTPEDNEPIDADEADSEVGTPTNEGVGRKIQRNTGRARDPKVWNFFSFAHDMS
jgi:hypothetical protein